MKKLIALSIIALSGCDQESIPTESGFEPEVSAVEFTPSTGQALTSVTDLAVVQPAGDIGSLRRTFASVRTSCPTMLWPADEYSPLPYLLYRYSTKSASAIRANSPLYDTNIYIRLNRITDTASTAKVLVFYPPDDKVGFELGQFTHPSEEGHEDYSDGLTLTAEVGLPAPIRANFAQKFIAPLDPCSVR
jgi:hypothetical protein